MMTGWQHDRCADHPWSGQYRATAGGSFDQDNFTICSLINMCAQRALGASQHDGRYRMPPYPQRRLSARERELTVIPFLFLRRDAYVVSFSKPTG
jgi:hypothetical protein